MPTYQYTCTECGHPLEVVQSFTDDALTQCPECGGRLRKVYGAVGVVFKGSGFYRTDSRGKDTSESGAKDSGAKDSSSTGSGAKDSGAKSSGAKESGSTGSGSKDSGGSKPSPAASGGSGSTGS